MIYRKPLNKKYYMQWRGSWADKPYSGGTVSDYGCGLVAITHLALEQGKSRTPNSYYKYMLQFTEDGKGTMWYGITEAMKYIGLKEVKEYEGDIVGNTMTEFYKEMKKGDRVGVILFQNPLRPNGTKKAPDGTVWTNSGHFVAVLGIKKVKKTYYLYVKDSDDEEKIGWFSYIHSMKGCIRYLYTGKI